MYEADGVTQVAEASGSSGTSGVIDWSPASNAGYFLEVSAGEVVGASDVTDPISAYSLKNTIVGRVPGDYNGDANVDGLDFLNWQQTFESTTDLAADGDNDGVVTGLDLDIWRDRFGLALAGPSSRAVNAVTAELRSEPGGFAEQSATLHGQDAWRGAWLASEPSPHNASIRANSDAALHYRAKVYWPEVATARDIALQGWSDPPSAPWRPAATASQAKAEADHNAAGPADASRLTDAEFDAAITVLLG